MEQQTLRCSCQDHQELQSRPVPKHNQKKEMKNIYKTLLKPSRTAPKITPQPYELLGHAKTVPPLTRMMAPNWAHTNFRCTFAHEKFKSDSNRVYRSSKDARWKVPGCWLQFFATESGSEALRLRECKVNRRSAHTKWPYGAWGGWGQHGSQARVPGLWGPSTGSPEHSSPETRARVPWSTCRPHPHSHLAHSYIHI